MGHAPDGDDIGGTFGAIGGAVQRFGLRLSARVGARPVFESESRLFNGLRRHVKHRSFFPNFKWLSYKR
jgi:hypothetical protein